MAAGAFSVDTVSSILRFPPFCTFFCRNKGDHCRAGANEKRFRSLPIQMSKRRKRLQTKYKRLNLPRYHSSSQKKLFCALLRPTPHNPVTGVPVCPYLPGEPELSVQPLHGEFSPTLPMPRTCRHLSEGEKTGPTDPLRCVLNSTRQIISL